MKYNLDFTTESAFKFNDNLVEYSGGVISLKEIDAGVYTTEDQVVIYEPVVFTSHFHNVASDFTGDVTFFFILDDTAYYHDGTDWVVSNRTAIQSNTITELNDELDPEDNIDLPEFTALQVGIILSSDGAAEASISSFDYNYYPVPTDIDVDTAKVFFSVRDFTDQVQDTTITIQPNRRGMVPYKSSVIVLTDKKTVETQDGYTEVDLIETTNMGVSNYYLIQIAGHRLKKTVPELSGKINVLDLPDVT